MWKGCFRLSCVCASVIVTKNIVRQQEYKSFRQSDAFPSPELLAQGVHAVVARDQEVCETTIATLKLRYHVPRIKKRTLNKRFAVYFLNKASKSITLTWHSAVMAVVPVDFHPLVPVRQADSFLAPTSVSEKLTSDPVHVPGCSLIFQIWYLTLFEMVFGDVVCL